MPVCLVFAFAGCAGASTASDPPSAAPAKPPVTRAAEVDPTVSASASPVLLELFTSQGCSSCPPADRLLAQLIDAGASDGRPVLALAYHVDYWDYLGWADPFAQAAWSERQQVYAARLGRGPYTPQLVVAGRSHVVGSYAGQVAKAIAAAPEAQALAVTATREGNTLTVTGDAPAGADLWLATYTDGHQTEVTRGENGGATLASRHVVRQLVQLHVGRRAIALTDGVTGAVVFAQAPDVGAIVGAVDVRL